MLISAWHFCGYTRPMNRAILLLALASACTPSTEPTWALGSIYLEPEDDGATGFISWSIYGADWDRRMDERHYLCAVVTRIDASPGSACPDCTVGFGVASRPLETDCPEGFDTDTPLPQLSALGLGPVPSELVAENPYPDVSLGSYAQWNGGPWTTWGWMWPEELEYTNTVEDGEWDGRRTFVGWPSWAWELQPEED